MEIEHIYSRARSQSLRVSYVGICKDSSLPSDTSVVYSVLLGRQVIGKVTFCISDKWGYLLPKDAITSEYIAHKQNGYATRKEASEALVDSQALFIS